MSYGFNTVYSLANCYIAIYTFITIWSERLEYCFQLIRREYSRRYSIVKREVTYVVYFIGHTKMRSLQLSNNYVKNNSDHGLTSKG